MRIALDVHGVIDTNMRFFREFTNALIHHGEIHILTGSSLKTKEMQNFLNYSGIRHSHAFSISDHLREHGVPELERSTLENPWFSDLQWDRCKAEYCERHEIDLCLDDRDAYLQFFKTPIARYYSKG